jgi:heme oxygenase
MVGQSHTMAKRIKDLERDKRELKSELEKIKDRYKGLNDKYTRINFEAVHSKNSNDYISFMKQIRNYEEEKKATEIRFEELEFQNRVLEQELTLYRGNQRGQ